MQTVFSAEQLLHAPSSELADGKLVPAHETPERARLVLEHAKQAGIGPVTEPRSFSLEPLLKIHDEDYINFLKSFWQLWQKAGRTGQDVLPYVWPVHGLRHDTVPEHIDGKLGYYSFDAGTAMGLHTWTAAKAAADCALTAAELISEGESSAFALCRPPGHHAHRRLFGGYCFLNNAALAAQHLREKGAEKVSILDIDYHHGNGTQAIFYDRSDVQFLSIHADPNVEFPFFLGHASETGLLNGAGFNHNYPLPLGIAWERWSSALEEACTQISQYGPDTLIISLGLDAYENDPISQFKLTSDDFARIGAQIAKLGKPTVFILEGGYAISDLGQNCMQVLQGYLDHEIRTNS